jgi:hypothetical protein
METRLGASLNTALAQTTTETEDAHPTTLVLHTNLHDESEKPLQPHAAINAPSQSPADADDLDGSNGTSARARLVKVFKQAGYNPSHWERDIPRLANNFRALENAATFAEKLVNAGWHKEALKHALASSATHRHAGTERILRLQQTLVEEFGFNRTQAIEVLSSIQALLVLTPDELIAKVQAAIGDSDADAVYLLLGKAAKTLVKKETAWLETVRRRCEARGIDVRKNPYFFIAAKNKEERESDGASEKRGVGGTPGANEPCRPVCAFVVRKTSNDPFVDAFLGTGWNEKDAAYHLAAFPDLRKLHPLQLLNALRDFAELLGLKNRTFTIRLQRNARRIVMQMKRMRDEVSRGLPLPKDAENTGLFTSEMRDEAQRIATCCHASQPSPDNPGETRTVSQVITWALLSMNTWKYGRGEAISFLGKHPELLFAGARPIFIVQSFVGRFLMSRNKVRLHLEKERERAVLFEEPETFDFLRCVNALRGIDFPFYDIGLKSEQLDFTRNWWRLYADIKEVTYRLNKILEDRLIMKRCPATLFRGTRGDFTRELDKLPTKRRSFFG